MYERLLRQFVEQQASAADRIGEALVRGDAPLAERLAHTLKGLAGTLGAKAVQTAAGVLEKRIRDGAAAGEVEAARREAGAALATLVEGLRKALGTAAAEDLGPGGAEVRVEPGQARAAGQELARLLAEFDPGAVEYMEGNATALKALVGSGDWPVFEGLVRGYSLAEAQARLEE